jgi:hypothetical protein
VENQLRTLQDDLSQRVGDCENNLSRLDELIIVFTNLKAKILQDHEPRITELEALSRELKEALREAQVDFESSLVKV